MYSWACFLPITLWKIYIFSLSYLEESQQTVSKQDFRPQSWKTKLGGFHCLVEYAFLTWKKIHMKISPGFLSSSTLHEQGCKDACHLGLWSSHASRQPRSSPLHQHLSLWRWEIISCLVGLLILWTPPQPEPALYLLRDTDSPKASICKESYLNVNQNQNTCWASCSWFS